MRLAEKPNPNLDAIGQRQAIALEEVKQAKAKLDAERQAMLSLAQHEPLLSDHIIDNLDDNLDEARKLIREARGKLAQEPLLFPGAHIEDEKIEAPADHEQAIKDIQRDVRIVRAAIAQQNEPSVVRKEFVVSV